MKTLGWTRWERHNWGWPYTWPPRFRSWSSSSTQLGILWRKALETHSTQSQPYVRRAFFTIYKWTKKKNTSTVLWQRWVCRTFIIQSEAWIILHVPAAGLHFVDVKAITGVDGAVEETTLLSAEFRHFFHPSLPENPRQGLTKHMNPANQTKLKSNGTRFLANIAFPKWKFFFALKIVNLVAIITSASGEVISRRSWIYIS